MCGIGAVIQTRAMNKAGTDLSPVVRHLLAANFPRGPDSFGYAWASQGFATVRANKFSSPGPFEEAAKDIAAAFMGQPTACILNYRGIPTTEAVSLQLSEEEIQPFLDRDRRSAVVHNGIISNDREISTSRKMQVTKLDHDIDSYCLLDLDMNDPLAAARLKGSFSFIRLDLVNGILTVHLAASYLGCNLYVFRENDNEYLIVSSERLNTDLFDLRTLTPIHYETLTIPVGGGKVNDTARSVFRLRRPLVQTGQPTSGIAVISGGLDSTLAAYLLAEHVGPNGRLMLLHFDYGCRASAPENDAVRRTATHLQARYPELQVVTRCEEMLWLKSLGGSTLTDVSKAVAVGEEGAETISEWVPARNLAMIGVASAIADAQDYSLITLGLNREEASVFSDNSSEFFDHMDNAVRLGTRNRAKLWMPVSNMMKHHIVAKLQDMKIPFTNTWSCYHGGGHRCGSCGPCLNTRRALTMRGIADPFTYKDHTA